MWQERTEKLIGKDALEILASSRVAVFGVGGVGSYAVEALARAGVGAIDLIDSDIYTETNLNRQLYACISTLGVPKVEAAKRRIADISPDCRVNALCVRFTPETAESFDFSDYSYVIDAIDSIDCKTALIAECVSRGVRIISSMGAGNRLNAGAFRVADIYETSADPLARVMRSRLRKAGIKKLKTVYSAELPKKPDSERTVGSLSCVTGAAGLLLAGTVINDLVGQKQ